MVVDTHTTPTLGFNRDGVVFFSGTYSGIMNTPYSKRYLPIEKQLTLLHSRGLAIQDFHNASTVLKNVGYFKLSSYLYPFREIRPHKERITPWNYRYNRFKQGFSLDDAIALFDFDRRLSLLMFEALSIIETSFKALIADAVGAMDPFLHLKPEALDRDQCGRPARSGEGNAYSSWLDNYHRQRKRSKNEDYLRHHRMLHGDDVPIWMAVEFLDFGSTSYLFRLLPKDLKNAIARSWDVKQGSVVDSWVRNFNYTRNLVAHHSRLWNRHIVTRVQPPNPAVVDPSIHHLAKDRGSESSANFNKIYPTLALSAYVLSSIGEGDNWRSKLRLLMAEFPIIEDISPEKDMGFPAEWAELDIWNVNKTQQQ